VAPGEDGGEIGGDISQKENVTVTPASIPRSDVPPHKHTTSGKTANLGEGKSFSVVEAHTLLMCWARVA
jgi:hypothetical protein